MLKIIFVLIIIINYIEISSKKYIDFSDLINNLFFIVDVVLKFPIIYLNFLKEIKY